MGANDISKFGNKKYEVDGIVFDSKKEAERWFELLVLEKTGMISHLQRQVRFELIPPQYIDGKCVERACTYIADFVYWDEYGRKVVEDVKGFRTDVYKIKKKLMLHVQGIQIKEV